MHLTPREQERLLLAAAADLARRRLARGAPLGATEAVALVCDEICELAWDGVELAAVIERARAVVPAAALLPGVASLVPVLEVEALFPWGTTLVHVDRPFPEDQNQQPPYLERTEETLAPSGSPDPAVDAVADATCPGEVRAADGDITLAPGLPRRTVVLLNTGRRDVWISSHFPLDQVNPAVEIRFADEAEPGDATARPAGRLPPRPAGRGGAAAAAGRGADGGGGHHRRLGGDMSALDRGEYAARYGPTTGDRVRLADTDLWVEVEGDDVSPGDELIGGCGKTARDGVLVTSASPGRASALDLIIPNVLVLDPVLGVRKTSIGIAGGRIVGTGRAGNPDVQAGVDLVVDSHTAILPGEGLIATAGLIDSHVHASSPQIAAAALSSGITTVVAMGIGGVWDVGANPAYNLRAMIAGWTGIPLNAAFLARGSTRSTALLEAAVEAGAGGFKVHEDWGATPAQIDACLTVAEAAGLPVALHTDTLNESGYLADTVAATAGRTVHAYHVEGGGGHPDVLEILNHPHILGSSTTPTLPLTPATIAELVPMTMTVHKLHARLDSDAAIASSRIRRHGIAAENFLHDLGAISIINSDSMGMGRIAEVARRTWQLAHVQATLAGQAGPSFANNDRVLRYLAKITLNPAIAHGLAAQVGSLTAGRLADIVLWDPARFGATPEIVLKSGFVAWGTSGSGSGSTRITQPRVLGPFFGGLGDAPRQLAAVFVAESVLSDTAARGALPGGVRYLPITGARGLTRADMIRNSVVPRVSVPVVEGPVSVDGVPVPVHEATSLPLTRLHHLG